jgi:hypothetical protein
MNGRGQPAAQRHSAAADHCRSADGESQRQQRHSRLPMLRAKVWNIKALSIGNRQSGSQRQSGLPIPLSACFYEVKVGRRSQRQSGIYNRGVAAAAATACRWTEGDCRSDRCVGRPPSVVLARPARRRGASARRSTATATIWASASDCQRCRSRSRSGAYQRRSR